MIEIATSLMILISSVYGAGTVLLNSKDTGTKEMSVKVVYDDKSITDGKLLTASAVRSNSVEDEVREYFKKTPILAEIAKCESDFKHLGSDGEIIKGTVNKGDIGVMQINKYYHAEEAKKLGINLNTLKGNLEYAKLLYDKNGTAPWQSSSGCWEKYKLITKK